MSRANRLGGHGDPERTESVFFDAVFRRACRLAKLSDDDTPPTRRQARKWARRFGAAWSKRQDAIAALESKP